MVLSHVKATEKAFWADRKRSNGFFDGVRNVADVVRNVCVMSQKKNFGLLYF